MTDNGDDDAFADPAEEEDAAPGESFFSDDDGKLPEIFLNDQYDGMEEEPKPMSYRDEESYNYQQPQFFVPTVSRRDADDLLFPPFSSPGKGKGIYLLKTLMWMASVVIAAMAIFLIFRITVSRAARSRVMTSKRSSVLSPSRRGTFSGPPT